MKRKANQSVRENDKGETQKSVFQLSHRGGFQQMTHRPELEQRSDAEGEKPVLFIKTSNGVLRVVGIKT